MEPIRRPGGEQWRLSVETTCLGLWASGVHLENEDRCQGFILHVPLIKYVAACACVSWAWCMRILKVVSSWGQWGESQQCQCLHISFPRTLHWTFHSDTLCSAELPEVAWIGLLVYLEEVATWSQNVGEREFLEWHFTCLPWHPAGRVLLLPAFTIISGLWTALSSPVGLGLSCFPLSCSLPLQATLHLSLPPLKSKVLASTIKIPCTLKSNLSGNKLPVSLSTCVIMEKLLCFSRHYYSAHMMEIKCLTDRVHVKVMKYCRITRWCI